MNMSYVRPSLEFPARRLSWYATDDLAKSVSLSLNEARTRDLSGCFTEQPLSIIFISEENETDIRYNRETLQQLSCSCQSSFTICNGQFLSTASFDV